MALPDQGKAAPGPGGFFFGDAQKETPPMKSGVSLRGGGDGREGPPDKLPSGAEVSPPFDKVKYSNKSS